LHKSFEYVDLRHPQNLVGESPMLTAFAFDKYGQFLMTASTADEVRCSYYKDFSTVVA